MTCIMGDVEVAYTFFMTKAWSWLHGCAVTQLRDAILALLIELALWA